MKLEFVNAAFGPRIAPNYSIYSQKDAFYGAMFLYRPLSVFGTAGIVTAMTKGLFEETMVGRENTLIKRDKFYK